MSYPVVLAIMDGVGLSPNVQGNAVAQAHLEFLSRVSREYLNIPLNASGEAVGLPADVMGNSEVGHNTIGCGQIVKQGVARVNEAFETGEVFDSPVWKEIIARLMETHGTLHFSGIFSDGGVHSDISHLEQMIKKAYEEGVRKVRVHCVFDGRDVAPQSEPKYIQRLEKFFAQFPEDADFKIASGGGRMVTVADRYENDWGMVEKGWRMMVEGKAALTFKSAEEAIRFLRSEDFSVSDQYLPAFVIVDEKGEPVGKVKDGDAFVYFDFRADRAIEIAQAFTYEDFPYFDRGERPDVYFAGMTEYNSDTHVPEHRLIEPVKFSSTLHEFLGEHEISQLAISETVKFGHITYYFNGNSYEKAPGEEFVEIKSYTEPFNTRPWMKAAEVGDEVVKALEDENSPQFIRVNFPGGDMVGHFGEMEATMVAMEAIDIQMKRIAEEVDKRGGVLIITADHGNAEELIDLKTGEPKSAHTTNKVPCIFYTNTLHVEPSGVENPGLANLAATVATLLRLSDVPEKWQPSLVKIG